MKTDPRSLIDGYLAEVRAATHSLPSLQRDSIVSDIEAHIEQALSAEAGEAEVRTVLERLGAPEAIAAEAGAEPSNGAPVRVERAKVSRWKEVVALLGISIGSIVLPVIGWAIGVIFLWMSPIWSSREKLAGTLIWPFGWVFPLGLPLVVVRSSIGGPSGADLVGGLLVIAALGAPIVVLGFLIRTLVSSTTLPS